MKKIEIILKPFQLDEVRDALAKINIGEIVVSDVRCSSHPDEDDESYLSDDYLLEFLPKIRIELFVKDEKLDAVIALLKEATEADAKVTARIFIYDIQEA